MKFIKKFFYFCLLVFITSCATSGNISKCAVPFENRGEISLTKEETDKCIQFTLETSDPVALRTLLMQGFKLNFYGKDKESDTITIEFPSANDVSDKIDHHPGEVKATLLNEKEKRPDLRPLVSALNEANVTISKRKKISNLHNAHQVSVDPSTGILSYAFSLTYETIKIPNFSATLISVPKKEIQGKNEFSEQGFTNRSNPNTPQPLGASNGKDKPQKEINIDFKFD